MCGLFKVVIGSALSGGTKGESGKNTRQRDFFQ